MRRSHASYQTVRTTNIVSLTMTGIFLSFVASSCTQSKKRNTHRGGSKSVIERYQPWDSSKRRKVRTTAYSHKEREPGAPGRKNAIGTTLRYGMTRSAAADWSRFPLGTRFRIVGSPFVYEIDDYGSALVGTDTIDLFKPTLRQMNDWGTRHVDINIIEWGSFERSNSYLEKRTQYPHCRAMYRSIQHHLRVRQRGRHR